MSTPEYYEGYISEPLMLTLCLEEDSILVSKAIMDVLSKPKQIQMLINEEQKKLLIQRCSTEDREAVVIPPYSAMPQFEMSGHSLLKRIRKLTGWLDDTPRVVYGTYMPQHEVIVFDLMSAQLARLQMPLSPTLHNPS